MDEDTQIQIQKALATSIVNAMDKMVFAASEGRPVSTAVVLSALAVALCSMSRAAGLTKDRSIEAFAANAECIFEHDHHRQEEAEKKWSDLVS